MFDSVGARSMQLLKPLGLLAAIQLLNVFGVFNNIYRWFSFNAHNCYKSTYDTITGMNFTWLFLKGQTMPIQMGYTHSNYRDKAEWVFNERTQMWMHHSANYGAAPNYFPFVMCTLVTPEGEYDLTEHFNGQTYYYGQGRKTMPLPAQLLNMWSIMTHKWFTAAELRQSYFTIMGNDCNTYTIPVILRNADGVRIYSELFGIRIPESDEESSETDSDESDADEGFEAEADEDEGEECSEEDSEGNEEDEDEDEEGSEEDESEEGSEGDEEDDDEEGSEGDEEEEEDESEESSQEEGSSQEDKESSDGKKSEDDDANNKEDTPSTPQLGDVPTPVQEVPDMEQVD